MNTITKIKEKPNSSILENSIISNTKVDSQTNSNNGYPGKSITDTIINGFFTVDRNWTVKYWNKAAEKLIRVSAKDIVGKNLWETVAGFIPLDFNEVYNKVFLQDIPFHFEEYWGEWWIFRTKVYHLFRTKVYQSFRSKVYQYLSIS